MRLLRKRQPLAVDHVDLFFGSDSPVAHIYAPQFAAETIHLRLMPLGGAIRGIK